MMRNLLLALYAIGAVVHSPLAHAGVFTTIQYLEPGQYSLGLEPEFVLSNGAGLGANVRLSTGWNELSNAAVFVGTGGGPRRFRIGAVTTYDFFPDVDGQPGIGLGLQGMWSRVSVRSAGTGVTTGGDTETQGRFDLSAMPYLHNRFANPGGDVEPYLAIPVGFSLRDGRFQASTAVAIGSFFHMSRQIQYSLELNVGGGNAETILSGGMVYLFE